MDDIAHVDCPCCGARSTVEIDFSAGRRQEFTQDCPVCCRPWIVTIDIGRGRPIVNVRAE